MTARIENDNLILWQLRDNAIDESRKRLISTYQFNKYKNLGWGTLALVTIGFFSALFLVADVSNSGGDNILLLDNYWGSTMGWAQTILSLILIYKGFGWLSKSSKIESKIKHEIGRLYSCSCDENYKSSKLFNSLLKENETLSDNKIESEFSELIKLGLNGSSIQITNYMVMHETFMNRYGYSPFRIGDYHVGGFTLHLDNKGLGTVDWSE